MRKFLFLVFSFFLSACVYTPEPKGSEASIAQEQIQENRAEAQMAQKEYERIQTQRISQ